MLYYFKVHHQQKHLNCPARPFVCFSYNWHIFSKVSRVFPSIAPHSLNFMLCLLQKFPCEIPLCLIHDFAIFTCFILKMALHVILQDITRFKLLNFKLNLFEFQSFSQCKFSFKCIVLFNNARTTMLAMILINYIHCTNCCAIFRQYLPKLVRAIWIASEMNIDRHWLFCGNALFIRVFNLKKRAIYIVTFHQRVLYKHFWGYSEI